jgi:hypothetical protein
LNETVPFAFTNDTAATGFAFWLSLHFPFFSLGRMPASVIDTLNVPLMPL